MSRSRKKIAGWCDRNTFMKNYANRRVRRLSPESLAIGNGNNYRRYCCPYDICDFKSLYFNEYEVNDMIREFPDYYDKYQFYMK